MKKISVVIPCYNDSASVANMYNRLVAVFRDSLPKYNYEIIYADDCSPDNGKTWGEIKRMCELDPKHVKGVRNSKNFGFYRNCFETIKYGKGDAVFLLLGDIQDPPEALPEFVKYWEDGHKVVVGQRQNSYNKVLIRSARKIYYSLLEKLSKNKQIEGVNGYGLYDKSFVKILYDIEDIQSVIPGIINEYVNDIKIITIQQQRGGRGKSNMNFWIKYDCAMIALTSYTKVLLRMATFVGVTIGILSVTYVLFIVIYKILFWDRFEYGIPTIIVGMFFLGALQVFFIGILGEYILSINNRSMKRPLVVIDEKINFEKEDNIGQS
jgi:glycosyltransferase involved in cell wall biosynthesis